MTFHAAFVTEVTVGLDLFGHQLQFVIFPDGEVVFECLVWISFCHVIVYPRGVVGHGNGIPILSRFVYAEQVRSRWRLNFK
jgi:hypothetical protein